MLCVLLSATSSSSFVFIRRARATQRLALQLRRKRPHAVLTNFHANLVNISAAGRSVFFCCFFTAPIMLLSHFQRAVRTVLPFRHLSLPLSKPSHAMALAPHRSFKPAPNPAPGPIFFPLRSFATSPPPSAPPLANPAAPTQQPAAPAATAFLRSSVFWGDTKPGCPQAALPSPSLSSRPQTLVPGTMEGTPWWGTHPVEEDIMPRCGASPKTPRRSRGA